MRSHRLRSFLTVLGILIGIAGVIIAVGLGEGASGQVTSEINALGSNVLTITPGSTTSSTGIRGALGSASTLTTADVSALASHVDAPDIKAVAGITSQSEVLTAGSQTATTTVQGTTPSWLTVRGRTRGAGPLLGQPGRQGPRRCRRAGCDDRLGAVHSGRSRRARRST